MRTLRAGNPGERWIVRRPEALRTACANLVALGVTVLLGWLLLFCAAPSLQAHEVPARVGIIAFVRPEGRVLQIGRAHV